MNTAHVSSFVLISILRGQPRTPPSGDNLGVLDYHLNKPPRGGGGGTRVTYFAVEGVLFKTSACPRFCKRRVLISTQVRSMGGENPLTIHEIYAALTPSDSRSDSGLPSLLPPLAAAKQAEYYKI